MTSSDRGALPSIGGLSVRHPPRLDGAVLELLRAQNVAILSTLTPRGAIRTRTVWVDTDGEHVVVNTVADRQWARDLERDATVTCTVVSRENPYEFVSIEGQQVDRTVVGAAEHIDEMARKYLGLDRYPFHDPAQPRVLVRISAERILHMAPEAVELD